MTHKKIVANCGKFMGWVMLGNYWRDKNSKCIYRWDKYDPTADTPKGILQANELWKKVDELKYHILFFDNGRTVQIEDALTRAECKVFAEGKGPWWNSALAAAVAELVEKEK